MPLKYISEANINSNPIKQFEKWFSEATRAQIPLNEAMLLSTANKKGIPSSRMVLLKSFDERGFVFFTNSGSRKGKQLKENPFAAIAFYWNKLGKQVRIEGKIEIISERESDEYFAIRPRDSQIGAWASAQSTVITDRKALIQNFEKIKKQYSGKTIPRPLYWNGYRLKPVLIEFWQNRDSRLHDRFQFTLDSKGNWLHVRLSP